MAWTLSMVDSKVTPINGWGRVSPTKFQKPLDGNRLYTLTSFRGSLFHEDKLFFVVEVGDNANGIYVPGGSKSLQATDLDDLRT